MEEKVERVRDKGNGRETREKTYHADIIPV
jgi:hypothetical protein